MIFVIILLIFFVIILLILLGFSAINNRNDLLIKGNDAKKIIERMNNPKSVSKEEYEKAEMLFDKMN